MSDWLHNLPLVWMAIFVFGCTFLVTAAIYWIVTLLAIGERARSFKAVPPRCWKCPRNMRFDRERTNRSRK